MKEEKFIIVYCRVSSAAQSIDLQLSAAKRALEAEGLSGNEKFILYLFDEGVSATKLRIEQRPSLNKLLQLTKEGKVEKLIVYKRDRLARNFFEFSDIITILIKNKVNVVFTASNEKPMGDESFEDFHGIFSQMEASNIQTRVHDSRKQYPSQKFGYIRKKVDGEVRFLVKKDKESLITPLFDEMGNVDNEEQFITFCKTKRKGLKDLSKIFCMIKDPFYAAQYESNNKYQPLVHVEQMVSLDQFLLAKSKLERFFCVFERMHSKNKNAIHVTPYCGKCGMVMKHRKENELDLGYFVCSNKHKRQSISVKELNDLLQKTITNYIQSITNDTKTIKQVMFKHVHTVEKQLKQDQERLVAEYIDTSIKISTHNIQNVKLSLKKHVQNLDDLKERQLAISKELSELSILREEVKSLDQMFLEFEAELSEQDIKKLTELLVDQVVLYDTHLQVNLFLSEFVKENDAS